MCNMSIIYVIYNYIHVIGRQAVSLMQSSLLYSVALLLTSLSLAITDISMYVYSMYVCVCVCVCVRVYHYQASCCF